MLTQTPAEAREVASVPFKLAQGETSGHDEKPEGIVPSVGDSCYSVAPELSSLPVF